MLSMPSDQDLYNELSCYTLEHADPSFIHQHIVDAYVAQHADENSKPIGVVFALIGLYLYVEKNFTGRQVQKLHMKLGRLRKQWERPHLPKELSAITVRDVLASPPGPSRDAMIRSWCASVWEGCRESRNNIVALAKNELGIV